MRKENLLVGVLIGLAVGAVFFFNGGKNQDQSFPGDGAATASKSIQWHEYEPGLLLAQKENKNVFLYFNAQWCTYCKKIKKTTFQNKEVQRFLNKNFVSISVDSDKNQALAETWQVRGLPTMWFLKPDGSKISTLPGYVDAKRLLVILKYIRTESYETMSFKEFEDRG